MDAWAGRWERDVSIVCEFKARVSVRHLVLPDDLAGSDAVFRFLAEEISPNT